MNRLTKEEKKARIEAAREAKKAKNEAKKAAKIEKLRKKQEKKRIAREAKKAKRLARLEKEKAKKAALKEKKRIAKEKQRALKIAKTIAIKKPETDNGDVDIKAAAKNMKLAMSQIASQFALLNADKRAKKAKSIKWMGYDVETVDGNVVVKFVLEKTKKLKVIDVDVKPDDPVVDACVVDVQNDDHDSSNDDQPQEIEVVPAGDLYGQDGNVDGEIANIETINEDDIIDDENDEDDVIDDNDSSIPDSRDEQNEELIEARKEFFGNYGDDFEPMDC